MIFLISQLFYDNDQYYSFFRKNGNSRNKGAYIRRDHACSQRQADTQIVTLCGASLPRKFIRILDKYEDNPAALMEVGIMYTIDQIIDLATNDIDGIHIYTTNRPEVATKIMENISHILKRS